MGLGNDKNKEIWSGPVRDFINKEIKSNDVVIFSKTYCPFCVMAKRIFNKLDQMYKAVELDSRKDRYEIQETLGKLTGATTVPRVFIKGKCVGGANDTERLFKSGELKKMLGIK